MLSCFENSTLSRSTGVPWGCLIVSIINELIFLFRNCEMALSGITILYCVKIRLVILNRLCCSFWQFLIKVSTSSLGYVFLLGMWSGCIYKHPLCTPTLIQLDLSVWGLMYNFLLDLGQTILIWNWHVSSLLDTHSVLTFFLWIVVIIDIESISDETCF